MWAPESSSYSIPNHRITDSHKRHKKHKREVVNDQAVMINFDVHRVEIKNSFCDFCAFCGQSLKSAREWDGHRLTLKTLVGGGSIEILDPGLRPTIRNRDRRYKASLPASNRWRPGRRSCPVIGRTSPPRCARWYYPARPAPASEGCHGPCCKTRRVHHADGRHAVYRGHEPRHHRCHGSCSGSPTRDRDW